MNVETREGINVVLATEHRRIAVDFKAEYLDLVVDSMVKFGEASIAAPLWSVACRPCGWGLCSLNGHGVTATLVATHYAGVAHWI